MTAPADEPDAVALSDEHHPVAVVLDLVQPVRACGDRVGFGGEGEKAYSIREVKLATRRPCAKAFGRHRRERRPT